jgi:hypothetical protein
MKTLGTTLITVVAWASYNRAYDYLDELSRNLLGAGLTIGVILIWLGIISDLTTTNRKNSK